MRFAGRPTLRRFSFGLIVFSWCLTKEAGIRRHLFLSFITGHKNFITSSIHRATLWWITCCLQATNDNLLYSIVTYIKEYCSMRRDRKILWPQTISHYLISSKTVHTLPNYYSFYHFVAYFFPWYCNEPNLNYTIPTSYIVIFL